MAQLTSSAATLGSRLFMNVAYAIDYLKEKDRPLTFDSIVAYLSLDHSDDLRQLRGALRRALLEDPRVLYSRDGLAGKGSFEFRSKYGVRSQEQLLALLQKQSTAVGILVKDLKDGWPGAPAAIESLAAQGAVLVVRNKKDNAPKKVWLDDASLRHPVDEAFRGMWDAVKLPANGEEVREKLEAAGLKPTTAKKVVQVVAPRERKRKAARGGRQTNTHMIGILRDYSHKRK
ncbi:hypothetical protein P152DRAFT_457402 [Eremomyces bilateralis CBS 781.70]|uniref:TFIIE beta domain-containing protein n=1 Tax=Eremomyces bilateralis CBS 781.70 TaxID=1392243 RepID=A0A6G1G7Z4_9PEZI|nr:uncharacterized protein P152DRAFT_457402 [Eremomyces bilateralis CBS 781.70]KAF1814041.1 hypothetical protein P152DRAFT_457402 [Eremomyces bilateralis CBS 781.70]